MNILKGLNPEEFRTVRGLVIDMVLATDMSEHFHKLKEMKLLLSSPDLCVALCPRARASANLLPLLQGSPAEGGAPLQVLSAATAHSRHLQPGQGQFAHSALRPASNTVCVRVHV